MVVGSLKVETDIVVIGSGSGGYVCAIRAAQLGKTVLLIEKEKEVGGVCLQRGCIPTKALIHASNLFNHIKNMGSMGINIKNYSVNLEKMSDWKNGILKKLGSGVRMLCEKHGIEIITGKAVFTSSSTLRIEGKSDVNEVSFSSAIIASGSLPVEIPGFPFDNPLVLSSKDALELREIPKKLIIIGGGYIGTEMGTVYGKLGSDVHILEMAERLLPGIEADLVSVVSKKLSNFSITPHFKTKATEFFERDGKAVVKIEEDGNPKELVADKVLVVVGRKPNTNDLGLDTTKVTLNEKGFINTDSEQRTNDPNIFAIGDCAGQPMLAHKASKEGKIAAEVASGKKSAFDNKVIPFVVFNDPEICSVGLTETQAKEKEIDVISGRFPFSALGRAMTLNETKGFVKWVADKKTHIVLGFHGVGPNVSDIVSEAALAIELCATLEDVSLTIHPHPTLGESLMEAADTALGEAIHIFQAPKKE